MDVHLLTDVIFRFPNRRKTFVMMNYIAHKVVRHHWLILIPRHWCLGIRKIHFTAFDGWYTAQKGWQFSYRVNEVKRSWKKRCVTGSICKVPLDELYGFKMLCCRDSPRIKYISGWAHLALDVDPSALSQHHLRCWNVNFFRIPLSMLRRFTAK